MKRTVNFNVKKDKISIETLEYIVKSRHTAVTKSEACTLEEKLKSLNDWSNWSRTKNFISHEDSHGDFKLTVKHTLYWKRGKLKRIYSEYEDSLGALYLVKCHTPLNKFNSAQLFYYYGDYFEWFYKNTKEIWAKIFVNTPSN